MSRPTNLPRTLVSTGKRRACLVLAVALVVAGCDTGTEDTEPAPPPDTTTTTDRTTTTTTTLPDSPVLWSGDELDDWFSTANSGEAFIEDVSHPVLGPALRLVNEDVDGSHNAGARINHQGFGSERVLPREAWYSATFFVPYFIDGQDNVFQFKQGDGDTRRHLWNVGWRPEGDELRLIIRTRLDGNEWDDDPKDLAVLDAVVPISEPFRLEVFRRASTGADGRYEVRMNGETVWEFDGPTMATNLEPRSEGDQEWVLSHYLGEWQEEVSPATSEIYITAAQISTEPSDASTWPVTDRTRFPSSADDTSPDDAQEAAVP